MTRAGEDEGLVACYSLFYILDNVQRKNERELVWIGSSRKDMRGLPEKVRRAFGVSLYAVQCGETPSNCKALTFFSGVLELKENDTSGTYRTVYAVKLSDAIYVLHVFQKKSKSGIATPKPDMDVIRLRLKMAEADASRPSRNPKS
jgi:phage-related protein